MTEPTDDEIAWLAIEEGIKVRTRAGGGETRPRRLGKVGQPAQTAEPVAWMRKWAFDGETPAKVKNEAGRLAWPLKFKLRAVTESRCLSDDMPLFTAPQPVAREPLSHAQAKALVLKYGNDPLNLVFQVELAHGIKGGQHGTE